MLQHLSVPVANLMAQRTRGAVVSQGGCSTRGCTNPPRTRGMCHNCYMRWHTRQTAFGRFESRYVEPEPARNHVRLLQDSMSIKAIAAAADVSEATVKALLVGRGAGAEPSKRLLRSVADSLLAVPVPPARDRRTTHPGRPTGRRNRHASPPPRTHRGRTHPIRSGHAPRMAGRIRQPHRQRSHSEGDRGASQGDRSAVHGAAAHPRRLGAGARESATAPMAAAVPVGR
ncbi:hypothetical protein M2280_005328 [Prescottella agglutinans]|uniref:Uncharacterized protein n=1 Tax=Prescottella agglutinans TaxID=1644129 RepID=A0ABT6MJU3_9NOCA|nr:hypothetical protein [Prescottella agglutinans]